MKISEEGWALIEEAKVCGGVFDFEWACRFLVAEELKGRGEGA